MAAIKRYSVAKTQDSCGSPSTTLGSTVYSSTEAWKAGTYDGTAAKGKPARRRLFLRALFKRDLRGRAAPIFKHTH